MTPPLTLAGVWNVAETKQRVLAVAKNYQLPVPMRATAFGGMIDMQEPSCRDILGVYAQVANPPDLRTTAVRSLVDVDAEVAARHAADLFAYDLSEIQSSNASTVLVAFLKHTSDIDTLASALRTARIEPGIAK